ncbi:type III-B CRISPR module-associated Cmr3 family protein [Nocardiopsis lambiniae]|uniref:Type III-B CRISPR module-associated Cmr3 family protein n=1 Tax=Nocardiopsis lambiniae TaxID=3075539 RepID=A0ABU2MBN7_9ACTN|nr:type III-B CRISPR module-associated Cmr3 family protein [Nocardiopsis sp. DSM 44743]MDT0329346.1 type III-B CRISPR module-associated Cmr3 family protein [Nocardiopsis sp. DSM 44743]
MVSRVPRPPKGPDTADAATRVWFALRPRDAVQVRDGRTFIAGAGGGARTRRPWPSTVAGALGAAFKAAASGGKPEPRTVRGPFLGRWDSGERRWHLAFPVPADVVPAKRTPRSHDRWTRLRPRSVPARTDLGRDESLWLHANDAGKRDDRNERDLWWGDDSMRDYLHHGTIGSDIRADLLTVERRTGIARQGRTVKHAHLYTSDFLRLREEPDEGWEFLALCELDPDLAPPPPGPVRLGGEGRLADLRVCEEHEGIALPKPPGRFPEGKVLVYLATPAIWRRPARDGGWNDTWSPPLPENARLVTAAIPGPEHVAGVTPESDGTFTNAWLRWAVPAGSVYLLRFTGPDPEGAAQDWAARAHGRAWGEEADNPDRDGRRLATAGFGLILTGTWT